MTEYGKIHTDGSRSGGQPVVATQKAHTAMLEVLAEWGIEPRSATPRQLTVATTEALCRAIEQHEDFKQEVGFTLSNEWHNLHEGAKRNLDRFRIPLPKPDPLVDVLLDMELSSDQEEGQHDAKWLRLKLKDHGLEIVPCK
jgi:hypothetical protein